MSVISPETPAELTPGNLTRPDEWRDVLLRKLGDNLPDFERYGSYYDGNHRMTFTTMQFRKIFGALFQHFADNWCDLVVDASAERLKVEGFRFGEPDSDDAAWEIWQRNGLDAESDMAHTDAIKLSCAYALVTPDDDGKALIQLEDATHAIVAFDPARGRRRLAGLRTWEDEWGEFHCVVYLPDSVTWWRRENEHSKWQDDEGSGSNPLNTVPLIPLPNNPALSRRLGSSDLARVIPLQDAVNKICGDMIVASEFAAYAQRWATGISIPCNPVTGEQMTEQFLGGADRVWTVPNENARFGNFDVSDLSNYVKAVEMLVQHIAAQTRTPPHYLLGQSGAFPSGESLKATETGLVAKVKRKQVSFGEGWERVMRLAFQVEGDTVRSQVTDAEVIWSNPESRMIQQTVDAAVKLQGLGVPRPALWEFSGFSPKQIKEWMDEGEPETRNIPEQRVQIQVPATPQQAEQFIEGEEITGPQLVPKGWEEPGTSPAGGTVTPAGNGAVQHPPRSNR